MDDPQAGSSKILGIKAIRQVTGMGLAQAKDLVEGLPQTIRLVHAGEIGVLRDTLTQAGFTFEVFGVANDHPTL